MRVHEITDSNRGEAEAALREIKGIYWELGEAQRIEYGIAPRTFDPLKFVDAVPATQHFGELGLLQEGAAVSVVCELADWLVGYDETSGSLHRSPRMKAIHGALESGRFDGVPTVRSAVAAAFERGEDGFLGKTVAVYVSLVLPRLQSVAANAVSGRLRK